MPVFNPIEEKARQQRLKELRGELHGIFDDVVRDKLSDILKSVFSHVRTTDTATLERIKNSIVCLCTYGESDSSIINLKNVVSGNIGELEEAVVNSLPRRKIAVMLPHMKLYGGIRRFLELGNHMLARNHDYRLYCIDKTNLGWFDYEGAIYPLDHILNEEFDVVMSGGVKTFPFFDQVKAKLKILHVIGRLSYKRVYDEYYKKDDLVLVGNSSDWRRYFPYMDGYTVPGAVNCEFFSPMSISKKDSKFVVMSYGRPGQLKGFEIVIEAMRMLDKSKFKLLLFNDTAVDTTYSGIDVEYALTKSQKDLRETYCSADLFVAMEEDGGWSNTSIEAMSCGLPLICNKVGTCDFAIPYETAIVIPDSNPCEIASAIQLMAEHNDLRYGMAEKAISMANKFSWAKYCTDIEKVFHMELDLKGNNNGQK